MPFVAVDGEGISDNYALIQDSQGGKLFRLEGLGTKEIFDWFFQRATELKGLDPTFVGFGLTYDCNMILRDVDDETLLKIVSKDDKKFVSWEGYEILYIPRKLFKLRRRNGDGIRANVFTLFDVFTFFGSSFITACERFLGSVPREIIEGKKLRGTFTLSQLKTIERYNELELEFMVKLCDRLNELFTSQGIELTKWHGPGAVAEFFLGRRGLNIHTDYPIFRYDHAYPALYEAWDCAYYGGRIENMGIGTFQNVKSYDINSAYPYALSMLPVLMYASEWKREIRPFIRSEQMSVYLVEWNVPSEAPFGPLPWRDKHGGIHYPLSGLGWYWKPEVVAAKAMFGSTIKLRECWYLKQGEPSKFVSEIPKIYARRNQLKKEGNPGEYALKIALNSCYGKLAQRVGNSPFRCIPWAGWITSFTRSMLLSATMGREKTVLAFSTDGVFSSEELPVSCGTNLGGWKQENADSLLMIGSGFYRLDGKTRKTATRGVRALFDDEWEPAIDELNRTQVYTQSYTQFVTHSLAIHGKQAYGSSRLKFVSRTKITNPFNVSKRIFSTETLTDWRHQHVFSEPEIGGLGVLSFPSSLIEYGPKVDLDEEDDDDD